MRIGLKYIITIFVFIIGMSFSSPIMSQRANEFIYGKVTTKSNVSYEGFLRWGKEELAWHDVFNTIKVREKHTKEHHKISWKEFNWNLSSIWEDKYREADHVFACFFGDIKAIYPNSSDNLDLELKNGTILKLKGGSNDVGSVIQVYDNRLGHSLVKWNSLKSIEFKQAPNISKSPFGSLLYGTIHTYHNGKINGYIKWDLDERAGHDILDGYDNGKDTQIEFSEIYQIKKHENGAIVKLVCGDEYFLKGTNDVNSSSRGIAIYNHEIGRIEFDWKEFKYVTFHDNPKRGPSYYDFKAPKGIHAEVLTYNEKDYKGMIVFDIDEKWELEFIDGDDDYVRYQIPFRNVKTIYPKNKAYSVVYLNNGDELLLGEKQDVSGENDGLLLFVKSKNDPIHIKWSDIIEINIK